MAIILPATWAAVVALMCVAMMKRDLRTNVLPQRDHEDKNRTPRATPSMQGSCLRRARIPTLVRPIGRPCNRRGMCFGPCGQVHRMPHPQPRRRVA